jgi:hypothetical protein
MTKKKCSIEAETPALRKAAVSGSFVYVRHSFNSRSHARQEMDKMTARGLISNYRIAWDTQLRMTVEVVYTDKCCDYEMHRRLRDEVGHWKCRKCGMLL